jgi:hypothetical protein
MRQGKKDTVGIDLEKAKETKKKEASQRKNLTDRNTKLKRLGAVMSSKQ